MKKNFYLTIPIFCFLYYVMLEILYGGNIYVVTDTDGPADHTVPINWIFVSLVVIFMVLSFLLTSFIKRKLVCHSILGVFSAGLCAYTAISHFSDVKIFLQYQNYSLPLFIVIVSVCYAFLTVAHFVKAFKREKNDEAVQ